MVSASRGGVLLGKRFGSREAPLRVRLPPLTRIDGQYLGRGAPQRLAITLFLTPLIQRCQHKITLMSVKWLVPP